MGLTSNGEDIDALTRLADGSLLISTTGNPSVSGLSGVRDEDLLLFNPTALGDTTSGAFSTYVDGSDIGLTKSGEDLNAVGIQDGELILSTAGAFNVPGAFGRDEDAFSFTPAMTGANTAGTFGAELFFDGSQIGFSGDVSALDLSIGY